MRSRVPRLKRWPKATVVWKVWTPKQDPDRQFVKDLRDTLALLEHQAKVHGVEIEDMVRRFPGIRGCLGNHLRRMARELLAAWVPPVGKRWGLNPPSLPVTPEGFN